jgi:acyl carrier protein
LETYNSLSLLIDVICRETGADPAEVNRDTTLDSLGVDSLEFLNLMLAIKVEIGEIPQDEFGRLNTVGDIADVLNRTLA